MRIGAIASSVKKRREAKGAKKRNPEEEELELLKKRDHTKVETLDIRENTKNRLMFRKLPWALWLLAGAFIAGALFLLGYSYFSEFTKGG